LAARSTDEKTGNYKLLLYQLKCVGMVGETSVDLSSWDKDSACPHTALPVAKYIKGEWFLYDKSKPIGQKWIEMEEI
jgi:hypothetical protein